MGYRPIV